MNKIVSTGIEGLDILLEGGLIQNRAILIQGEPGSGKTTFAMQYLIHGIEKFSQNGLLLALEYDISDLSDDMSRFGWPVQKLMKEKKLRLIPPPGGLESVNQLTIDDLLNLLHQEVSSFNIKRLVIDSIDTLDYFISSTSDKRREITRFITLLRDLGCTILLLNEWSEKENIYEFMTHGVVRLYNHKIGANRLRGLEIIKMRGINHSTLTHSMNIDTGNGIIVHPHEIDFTTI